MALISLLENIDMKVLAIFIIWFIIFILIRSITNGCVRGGNMYPSRCIRGGNMYPSRCIRGGSDEIEKNKIRGLEDNLRIYIISNKINDILSIKDSKREWIKTYYYAYINYLALNKQSVFANSSGYFPYNIPSDVDSIKEVLSIIRYDIILNERDINANINNRINSLSKAINGITRDINYRVSKTSSDIIITSEYFNIKIPNDLVTKYKVPEVTETDVINAILRYTADVPHIPNRPLYISGSALSVDPLIYTKLATLYPDKTIECFASPINHTLPYTSIYKDDIVFPGCRGNLTIEFFKKHSNYLYVANPPFDILSAQYTLKLAQNLKDSTMIIILPAKDEGIFNFVWGRKHFGRDYDFDVIKKLLKLPSFKSVIMIPSLFMYYIYLDSKVKKNITYDTLFIVLSNDNNRKDDFFNSINDIIFDIISQEKLSTTLKPSNVRKPDDEKIKKYFDPDLTNKILKNMEYSSKKIIEGLI